MPSSSTHTTEQETSLHACWRLAYIRLRSIKFYAYADSVTQTFAAVLDASYEDLARCGWPGVAPDEWKMLHAVQQAGLKLSVVERIEQAASACMEAGDRLELHGRVGEAETMAEMGKFLHALHYLGGCRWYARYGFAEEADVSAVECREGLT